LRALDENNIARTDEFSEHTAGFICACERDNALRRHAGGEGAPSDRFAKLPYRDERMKRVSSQSANIVMRIDSDRAELFHVSESSDFPTLYGKARKRFERLSAC